MQIEKSHLRLDTTTLVGHESVSPPGQPTGYSIADISQILHNSLEDIPIKAKKLPSLETYVTQLVSALSVRLDHISTIPHGINHTCQVTHFMLNEIPTGVSSLQQVLKDKYGQYWKVLAALTGLCHDIGYAYLARSPLAFMQHIFGRNHCSVGADIFKAEIIPLIKAAISNMPAEYLDDVEDTIRRHGKRFTAEEPLNGNDRPLLALLLLADKMDRVGASRLHELHQHPAFQEALRSFIDNLRTGEALPQLQETLAKISNIEDQIAAAVQKLEVIPEALTDIVTLLNQQLILSSESEIFSDFEAFIARFCKYTNDIKPIEHIVRVL